MSSNGVIRKDRTQVEWDEQKNQITIRPDTQYGNEGWMLMSYDQARELLDCLLVIFGRHDLNTWYPEVR